MARAHGTRFTPESLERRLSPSSLSPTSAYYGSNSAGYTASYTNYTTRASVPTSPTYPIVPTSPTGPYVPR